MDHKYRGQFLAGLLNGLSTPIDAMKMESGGYQLLNGYARLKAMLSLRDEVVVEIRGAGKAVVFKGQDGSMYLTFDGDTVDLFSAS